MAFFYACLLLGLFLTQSVVAQSCSEFGCSAVQVVLNTPCGVDPNDGSFLGYAVVACPCQPVAFTAAVTYTGVNGIATTETNVQYIRTTSVVTPITFSYTGANTNIQSNDQVTISLIESTIGANNPAIFPAISYTYSPVTSIFYTDTTTTGTVYASTGTTTTSTVVVSTTTAITQATSTIPCTTGTSTVTAKTSTITTTSTITPPVKTKTSIRFAVTTTQASCIATKASNKRGRREGFNALLEARQNAVNVGVVEVDWCPSYDGAPSSTTYTTSTVLATATVTTTDTTTSFLTSTTTTTNTPTPLTTTVCSNVLATSTTTPLATSTVVTILKQSTTSITQTVTYTFTVYPKHPTPCGGTKPNTAGKNGNWPLVFPHGN